LRKTDLQAAAQLLVMALAQYGLRHVDRALMVRHHRRDEITVDIAGRPDHHVGHHLVHYVAATEAVVTSEIALLRTNVRENKIILLPPPKGVAHGPALRLTQNIF
jgi:hypothetical protein